MSEDELSDLADDALRDGTEEAAIPVLRDAAVKNDSALLWQWTALLQRSLDRLEEALESFANAARLAPDDARIAQGRAHTAMEAGLPAVELFEQALRIEPRSGPVIIGLAAAHAAAGTGETGEAQLRAMVDKAPLWLNGHVQLAQLVATLGRPQDATRSVEQALAQRPGTTKLWEILLNIELRRGAYDSLAPILERARAAGVQSPEFQVYDAIHEAEFDEREFPPILFGPAPPDVDAILDLWRVRHLLRVGRADAALPVIDRGLAGPQSAELWAYAATVWRLTGDSRSTWLEGDPNLVQILDLTGRIGDLDALVARLRSLHKARGEYLDQSVRGGTQTDGPLFSRIDPEIRQLRAGITAAVEDYRARLPELDARHPTLRHPRDKPVRYSGSWSVRLRSGGHHSNHVHPQGWISSALYLALPDRTVGDAEHAGWFTLGQPDEKLGMDLAPWRVIEPKVAQLVLFPSWMWHGTVPFEEGERLTVAFDVAIPR